MKIYISYSLDGESGKELAEQLNARGHDAYYPEPIEHQETFSVDYTGEALSTLEEIAKLKSVTQWIEHEHNELNSSDVFVLVEPTVDPQRFQLGFALGAGKKTVVYYASGAMPNPLHLMADYQIDNLFEALAVLDD